MFNYKLTIQYDGGRYKGWQRLGDNDNTIQDKIEKVLSEMTGNRTEIYGSGRTDAGVHALAQIANFKTVEKTDVCGIKNYLNKYLPQDIRVKEVKEVPENFHARYNAKRKTYLYKICNNEDINPFIRKYSMHVEHILDIEKMIEASRYFIGSHDFTAFSNAKSKTKSMIRIIFSIDIKKDSDMIEIRMLGDGFLYNMARKIVGTLIDAGLNEISPECIPEILNLKERSRIGCLADACGLYLEKVEF